MAGYAPVWLTGLPARGGLRLRGFGRLEAGLLLLSIASGAAYPAARGIGLATSAVVFKALSIVALAGLAFRVLKGRRGRVILVAALALSSAGDVLLAVGPRRFFDLALRAFLLAHLAYVLLFVRSFPRPLRPSGRRLILAALVVLYGVLMTSWLAPGLGRHAVPVAIYACAITVMTVSAILAGFSRPYVVIGAILFTISDSLIAAARFKTGWTPAAYLIWPTYYLGQYLITIGFLQHRAGEDRQGRA